MVGKADGSVVDLPMRFPGGSLVVPWLVRVIFRSGSMVLPIWFPGGPLMVPWWFVVVPWFYCCGSLVDPWWFRGWSG